MDQSCNEAIQILQEVLTNADLRAVAAGGQTGDSETSTTPHLPMEKKLAAVCMLLREHSRVLLEQLCSINETASGGSLKSPQCNAANEFNDINGYALPRIVDTALFVRKSQLLRERVRRVNSTLGSVKHVGLLGDSSTGRRVITERAHAAVKELLDVVFTVASTLSVTPVLTFSTQGGEDVAPRAVKLPSDEFSAEPLLEHSELCRQTQDHIVTNYLICHEDSAINLPHRNEKGLSTVKEESNGYRSTTGKFRVAVLSKSFRGPLWQGLLLEENAIVDDIDGTRCTWKDIFAKDVGEAFGINAHSVWNIRALDVGTECGSGAVQRVQFHIRLPASVDDARAELLLRQCEFSGLLAQYTRLEEELESGGAGFASSPAVKDANNGHCELDDAPLNTHGNGIWNGDKLQRYNDINDESTLSTFPITLREEEAPSSGPPSPNEAFHYDPVGHTVRWPQQPPERESEVLGTGGEGPTLFQARLNLASSDAAPGNSVANFGVESHDADDASQAHGAGPLPNQGDDISNSPSLQPNSFSEDLLPISLFSSSQPQESCDVTKKQTSVLPQEQSINREWLSQLPPQPPQRRPYASQQDALQLLTTRHKKTFSGTDWDITVSRFEDDIIQTFSSEVTALFELSRECVKDVEFSHEDNSIVFGLVHDRYLLEDEINALIAVFDFPQVLKIHKRCLNHDKPTAVRFDCAAAHGAGGLHDRIDENNVVTTAPPNDLLSKEECCATPRGPNTSAQLFVDGGGSNPLEGEDECSDIAGIDWRQQQEFFLPSHEDSLTPDNEPATLTHIALLHDVPLELLIASNPHLATFDVDMPLPQSARLHIPRYGPLTETLSMSPSLRSQTPPSRRVKQEMNLRAVAMKLGVSVRELRQSNSHLDRYGDTELLPLSCSINVPALLVASADIGSFNSSQRSSPHSVVRATNRTLDQQLTTTWRGKDGTRYSSYQDHIPGAGEQPSESFPPKKPCSERTLARVESRSPSLLSRSESNKERRWHFTPWSEGGSPSARTAPRSSTARSIPPFIETAVRVMTRAVMKFLLLRFFAKWRFYARVKGHQAVKQPKTLYMQLKNPSRGEAQRLPTTGGSNRSQDVVAEKRSRPQVSDLRARLQELKRNSGTQSQPGAAPRSISKSVPRRDPSATREGKMVSPAVVTGGRGRKMTPVASAPVTNRTSEEGKQKDEYGRQGRANQRAPSAGSRLRRVSSEGRVSSPEKTQRGGMTKYPQRSRSLNNQLRFTSANPCSTGARSQSPSCEIRLKTGEPMMPEWIPIGLVISPERLTVEAQTAEASASGIERGDIIMEVDGKRVRTIRDVRSVLSSGLASHVFVTVRKRNKAIAAYRIPRSDGCR
ncbi:paraflagellar rod component, putative [Trypanosoma equiperdum]|uniref:Flagellar attachment zone protein 1 conserved domain-containing protein n=2 Tax=Trypanozoon TaxID=39700 RepID=Q388R4_TRYB2|nr:hypothetical protein, conserved [Trypanosoma brucei brucei TREU927]EAN78706.1 hypothetical protein, conserved [Trypanosoma brucei brucei TREU927]SCU72650.1 paraflagellar rod component, putative [Trypanosoma equiperdum]